MTENSETRSEDRLRTALTAEIDGTSLTVPEYDAVLADARGRVRRRRGLVSGGLAAVAVLGVAGVVGLGGVGGRASGHGASALAGSVPATRGSTAPAVPPAASSGAAQAPAITPAPGATTTTSPSGGVPSTPPDGDSWGYGGIGVQPPPVFTDALGRDEPDGTHWQARISGPENATGADGRVGPALCLELTVGTQTGLGKVCLATPASHVVGSTGAIVGDRRFYFGWLDDSRVQGVKLLFATDPVQASYDLITVGGHRMWIASWTGDHRPTGVVLYGPGGLTTVNDPLLQGRMNGEIMGFDVRIRH